MTEEENKTADEVTMSQRCAISAEVYNEIAVIAAAAKKTNCEIQVEGLRWYVAKQKLRSDCQTAQVTGEACKYADT